MLKGHLMRLHTVPIQRTEICLKPSERAFSPVFETHLMFRFLEENSPSTVLWQKEEKKIYNGLSFTSRHSMRFCLIIKNAFLVQNSPTFENLGGGCWLFHKEIFVKSSFLNVSTHRNLLETIWKSFFSSFRNIFSL